MSTSQEAGLSGRSFNHGTLLVVAEKGAMSARVPPTLLGPDVSTGSFRKIASDACGLRYLRVHIYGVGR